MLFPDNRPAPLAKRGWKVPAVRLHSNDHILALATHFATFDGRSCDGCPFTLTYARNPIIDCHPHGGTLSPSTRYPGA